MKGYYILRYLKSRDLKTKLLNGLNYYRELQKWFTLDMMEMGTRDRINGSCDKIYPNANQLFMRRVTTSTSMAELLMEALESETSIDHPVCLKSFKYRKLFKPKLSSTNPSLPKVHTSFDPRVVEVPLSEEQDSDLGPQRYREQARRFQDRIC